MRFRSLLGAVALGTLAPLALSTSPESDGDSDHGPHCAGCVGAGGGDTHYSGPGESNEIFFRIDMEKPLNGYCVGPFAIEDELTCVEWPCQFQAVTCWDLPAGVTGTQSVTGEPDLPLSGTMCNYPSGVILCDEKVTIRISVGSNSIQVVGTCSDCTF
ncbi:MAG: hypothetical protein AAF682_11555 [Planctomycetota bacterium]